MSDDQIQRQQPGTDENQPAPPPDEAREPHGDIAQTMREQEAIAAARLVGEQMRREDRSTAYFYAKRIGLFVSALSLAGMAMLFAYTQLARGDFSPTVGMLALAFLAAGGASLAYWAHTESKRSGDD